MMTTARLCTHDDGVMHRHEHDTRCLLIEFEGTLHDCLQVDRGYLYVDVEGGTYVIDRQQFLDAVHELLA